MKGSENRSHQCCFRSSYGGSFGFLDAYRFANYSLASLWSNLVSFLHVVNAMRTSVRYNI